MLIVLEGLDGAGKSTQIARLRALFAERGTESEFLHFPRFDAPVYGELIARYLRGELGEMDQVDSYLVALLFAGDRADAARLVRSWLDGGKTVILDRYVLSNVAYQCAKTEVPETERMRLRNWIFDLEYGYHRIPRPDVTLFLDVPLAFVRRKLAEERSGDDRTYLHGGRDIYESSFDLQRRVREVYLAEAGRDAACRVVDCSDEQGAMASPDRIFARIVAAMNLDREP